MCFRRVVEAVLSKQKELERQTALKRCKAMERRWKRKAVSRGSSVMEVMRCPISARNSWPVALIGPMVSKARGKNRWVRATSAYLLVLRWAAASAAEAALVDEIATYDVATVSVTVTSHVALRPSRHGINVSPSGRFPSDLANP